jgi:hypothetical protein
MAQDQLGYYYPPEDYPASELNPSDFILFNVSPALADASVDAAAVAARQLGFAALPQHPQMADDDPQAFLHAGTQLWPSRVEGADPSVDLLVEAKPSQAPTAPGQPDHTVSPATVDFGDGSPPATVVDEQRISHQFPRPGTYRVTTTVTDEGGYRRSYEQDVVVDPPPAATVDVRPHGGRLELVAGVTGGDGHVIAAHWTFSDGTSADGPQVVHAASPGLSATVTVVDGQGDTASTTVTP